MSPGEKPDILIIGGYRVAFVREVGWECSCESWSAGSGCNHCLLAGALTILEQAVVASGGSISRH